MAKRYFRPSIEALVGYKPGEQPKPGQPIIKLNTNENPYPPSPQAIAALSKLNPETLRRYPDPYATPFRQAVSDVLGVPKDWVLVGNGSDDILNIIIRACAEPGRPVVYPMPTYVLYRTLTQLQLAEAVEVSYGKDFQLPIDELVAAQGAVTFIATPNSPSGHTVPAADLRQLAAGLDGLLVIDEAYADFTESTALALAQEFDNVVISRTLSKGYGLAGLRLGFAIAKPTLLAGLYKVRDSYSVDAVAIAVGAAALRDQAYKDDCIAKVRRDRTLLARSLQALNFKVWPSETNFLLTQPSRGNAEAIYLALKQQNILVRYFKQPGLDDKLRITVGTPEQNAALITAMQALA